MIEMLLLKITMTDFDFRKAIMDINNCASNFRFRNGPCVRIILVTCQPLFRSVVRYNTSYVIILAFVGIKPLTVLSEFQFKINGLWWIWRFRDVNAFVLRNTAVYLNPLKSSGYHIYHQLKFTKPLYSVHRVCLNASYGCLNKQLLFP
jgi:hypothetical protein